MSPYKQQQTRASGWNVSAAQTETVDSWLFASWIGLALIVTLAFLTCADVGLTWDEPVELSYGAAIWNWYASGFADQHALWGLQSRYGGLFDAFAQLIIQFAPMPACETKHLLTLLAGISGVVATWKIANSLSNTRAGFIAASSAKACRSSTSWKCRAARPPGRRAESTTLRA